MEEQFPGSAEALRAVSRIVAAYRRELRDEGPKGLELELRFGKKVGKNVQTVVPSSVVDRVMSVVQTNAALMSDEWAELMDVYFDGNTGEELRSRVSYEVFDMAVHTETFQKRKLVETTLTSDAVDVRLVLSRETPAEKSIVPDLVVAPKHVRIQQRKKIHLCSREFDAPTFLIEFGMVWRGASRSEAERSQQLGTPDYTLELELLNPEYVVRHEDDYVATSMLLKANDFFQTYFEPLS